MKNKIILISGYKGSGKSTFAEILKNKLGVKYNTVIVPNAEEVKRIARLDFMWDGVKDERGRQLLVDITNAGYNYDPYFFEKCSMKRLKEVQALGTDNRPIVMIVPDWRYLCTYNYWKEHSNDIDTDIITTRKLSNDDLLSGISESVRESETELNDFSFSYFIPYCTNVKDLSTHAEILIDILL